MRKTASTDNESGGAVPGPDGPGSGGEQGGGVEGRDGISRRGFLELSLIALPAVGVAGAPAGANPASAAGDAGSAGKLAVVLQVNGRRHRLDLDPRTTLLDALRGHLALPGTKKGCEHGQCGACTVLVDDRRVLSCLMLAAMAADRRVTTIEGLADGEALHPVQAAFIKHDAFQCGYCTPGQIMSAVGLLNEGCPAGAAAIREQMSGNLCRCGAYAGIAAAVAEARQGGPR